MVRLNCDKCGMCLAIMDIIKKRRGGYGLKNVFWTANAELIADATKKVVVCNECGYSFDVRYDGNNIPYLDFPLKRKVGRNE